MINYHVNEKEGIVVAKLEDTYKDFLDEMINIAKESKPVGIMMKNRYVGRAKCSDFDVFYESIGKNIAKKRCLKKYYDDKIKLYEDNLESTVERFELLARNLEKLYEVRSLYED